jgi:hypothetical protein
MKTCMAYNIFQKEKQKHLEIFQEETLKVLECIGILKGNA